MTRLSLAISLALAAAAPAQKDFGPLDFVPTDAAVIAWVDGPARFSKAFAPTNLSNALAEARIHEDMLPWLEELGGKLERAFGPHGFDAETFGEALANHDGKIVVCAGVDEDSLGRALEHGNPDDVLWWASLIIAPNEGGHAGKMVKQTSDMLRGYFGDLTSVTASGITFSSIRFDDFSMSMPIQLGNHMVVVAGNDLAYTLEHTVTGDAEAIGDSETFTLDAPAGLAVRPQSLVRPLTEAPSVAGDTDVSGMLGTLIESFGFQQLDSLVVTAEPAEEFARFRADLQFRAEPTGFLAAFTAVEPGPPSSLLIIPSERDQWSITRVNWPVLYDAASDSFDVIGGLLGMSTSELEDEFTDLFRVRLREDVIAHLGDEMIQVGAGTPANGDADGAPPELQGICYGVSLENPEAFEASFDRMIRSRGLHAARRAEIYRGITIQRITVATVPVYYATPGEHLLVGIGNQGARELRAVLATIVARRERTADLELPKPVQRRLEHVTPGWQNIGATRVSSIIELTIEGLRENLVQQGLPSDHVAHHVVRNLSVFADVLRRHDLDLIVSTALAEGRRLRSELIW